MKHEGTFCFYLDYDGVTRRFQDVPAKGLGLPDAEFAFYFGRLGAALLRLGYSRIRVVAISDHAWNFPKSVHEQFFRPLRTYLSKGLCNLTDTNLAPPIGEVSSWHLISDVTSAERDDRCRSVEITWNEGTFGDKSRGVIIDDTSANFRNFDREKYKPEGLVFYQWNTRREGDFFSHNFGMMINRSFIDLGFSAEDLENIEQYLFNGKKFD